MWFANLNKLLDAAPVSPVYTPSKVLPAAERVLLWR